MELINLSSSEANSHEQLTLLVLYGVLSHAASASFSQERSAFIFSPTFFPSAGIQTQSQC